MVDFRGWYVQPTIIKNPESNRVSSLLRGEKWLDADRDCGRWYYSHVPRKLNMRPTFSLSRSLLLLVLALVLVGPAISAGDQHADLKSTIRAAIESDPRSSGMSDSELEGMATALSDEAAQQGVTASDIAWRPTEDQMVRESECGNINSFLCALTDAFGFTGSDLVIPIGLGVTSAFLLFVLGTMLLRHHGHHPLAGAIGSPASVSPASSPLPPSPSPSSLYE